MRGNLQTGLRLRTILPNGAVVYVEHVEGARKLVVQLFVSSRSTRETPQTNGFRHLLEHMTALGRTRSLDQNLETEGAFLTAETLRDAMIYQVCLRPTDLKLGLTALRSVMELGEVTSQDISKECAIIRQELALEDGPRKLSEAAWRAAYGDEGLDPLGNPDVMAIADPETLGQLHKKMLAGNHLTLVISGDVDLDAATSAAKDLMGNTSDVPDETEGLKKFRGGGVSSADVDGEALAVSVGSWNTPSTSAKLAAGLSIAAGAKNSFVTFTPSLTGGLIVVGRMGQTSGLRKQVLGFDAPAEFGLGRTLAKAWVERQTSIQDENVLLGLLISEGAGQRIETALDNLDRMTVAEFTAALDAFRKNGVVEILGK